MTNNIVKNFHPKLLEYKNKHKNQVCYIFGSGITINKFKIQEPGIFIGCNHIIKNKYIKDNLKYYFFGHGYYGCDKRIYGNHKEEVDSLDNDIKKLCMVSRNGNCKIHNFSIKTIEKLKYINAIPCDINLKHIYKDLDKNSFLNHSIVFPATQFALYCGFSKIYLVGCDCGYKEKNNQYFFNTKNKINKHSSYFNLIEWWEKMYTFKNKHYPNTKFININPVNLKKLMDEDIFT